MPGGLVVSLASAFLGGYVFARRVRRNEIPAAFIILGIVFLITAIGREVDAGFWNALRIR